MRTQFSKISSAPFSPPLFRSSIHSKHKIGSIQEHDWRKIITLFDQALLKNQKENNGGGGLHALRRGTVKKERGKSRVIDT